MGRVSEAAVRRSWRWVALAVAAAAVAVVASFTHPFTTGAETVTAVVLAVGVVGALWRLRTAPHGGAGRRRHRFAVAAPRWWMWTVVLAGAVAWELYCYVSSPRVEYPTLSSLIDMLDSTRPGKFVAFAAWLALGWFVVRR